MNARTVRQLRTSFVLMLVCIPVALCYEYMEYLVTEGRGRISRVGVFIGIVLALPLALLEESEFEERMKRLPFFIALVARSLTYVGSRTPAQRSRDRYS